VEEDEGCRDDGMGRYVKREGVFRDTKVCSLLLQFVYAYWCAFRSFMEFFCDCLGYTKISLFDFSL
jgi:hypothetical protein